jgi:tetratricopeptide (TPR) repeat protein
VSADLDDRLRRFQGRPEGSSAAPLAEALLAAGRAAEARDVTAAGLRALPEDPVLLLLDGRARFQAEDLLGAQAALLKVARLTPRDEAPFRWLGEVLLDRGDAARAKKVLERAKALAPEDAEIAALLARAEGRPPPAPPAPSFDGFAEDDSETVSRAELPGQLRSEGAPPPAAAPPVAPSAPAAARTMTFGGAPDDSGVPGVVQPPPEASASAEGLETLRGAPPPFTPADLEAYAEARIPPPSTPAAPSSGPLLAGGLPPAPPATSVDPGPAPAPAPPATPAEDPFAVADEGLAPTRMTPTRTSAEGALADDDVDGILRMLEEAGLFEPPEGTGVAWASRKDVPTSGTRTRITMAILWGLVLAAAGSGWYGYQRVREARHAEARELTAQAYVDALRGDHRNLIDAERELTNARELHPRDPRQVEVLLFVQAQRALEGGAFEAGYLNPALARAEALGVESGLVSAARTLVTLADRGPSEAEDALEALPEPTDATERYVVARIGQRLGEEGAVAMLEQAHEEEPRLRAATLALAEVRYDEGQAEASLAMLQEILAEDAEHLRARLWRAFLTSAEDEPEGLLAVVDGMAEDVDQHGAPTDKVLHALARARLLRRSGDAEAAGEAVDGALEAGASEPRILALVAREGQEAGRLTPAARAATRAVNGAPNEPEFRLLLAEVRLAQRDGRRCLETLEPLGADDPRVLALRARAALVLRGQEIIGALTEQVDAYVGAHPDAGVELESLRVRLHVEGRDADGVRRDAAALYEAHPGDPDAAQALAAVELARFRPDPAIEALGAAIANAPEVAELSFLLGRAHRMKAEGEASEAAFRRAIELAPTHYPAKLALGGLLLDLGRYADADGIYEGMGSAPASFQVASRLGRIEALLGLGRLDDAGEALEELPAEVSELASVRLARGRLALARGQTLEALDQLRALARGEDPSAAVLATYGEAQRAANQLDGASQTYAAALEADGGSPEALVGAAEVRLDGQSAEGVEDLLATAERSLDRRIRPPELRARLLLARGRLSGSVQALRRAAEAPAAVPDAFFFLGEALREAGNASDAQAAYGTYLERAPEGRHAAAARAQTGG